MNTVRAAALLDGLLLVDKAPDSTSFQVVKAAKRLLKQNKVGHTGTLDPIATGLLPICLGRATKLASIIMACRKEYDVWTRFGVATDSHDRTGQITAEKPWQHLNEENVRQAMQGFMGDIAQVPPMFSAVKYQGRPLYWYAHQGIILSPRKERTCSIFHFELKEWAPPKARFLIASSHGTYVRTLIHDLAEKLGSAAMVEELRRTACGHFRVEQAITLKDLEATDVSQRAQKVLSMNEALPDLPAYPLTAALTAKIRAGRTLMWSDLKAAVLGQEVLAEKWEQAKVFKLTGPGGELVAIASWGNSAFAGPSAGASLLRNRVVHTMRIFS